jgi:DNA-binding CsgD family transcriptional regulator
VALEIAKANLVKARNKQRKLQAEIDNLKQIIRTAGSDPDRPKIELVPRDKEIFRSWRAGKSFTELGDEYNLSTTRISGICRRIEAILRARLGSYDVYKDLLK